MQAGIGLYALFALIGVALLFDFLNGLHDAANSIATVVATRVLTPRIAAVIVLSPLLGFVLAQLLVLAVSWLFRRATPHAVDRTFRLAQFASASAYSLGHGGNDAQKTMGIIAVLLYSQGFLGATFHVP